MARRPVFPLGHAFGPPANRLRLLAALPLLWLAVGGAVLAAPGQAAGAAPGQLAVRFTGRLTFGGVPAQDLVIKAYTAVRRGERVRYTECGRDRIERNDDGRYTIDVPVEPGCVAPRSNDRYVLVAGWQNVGVCHYRADPAIPSTLGQTQSCTASGKKLPYLPGAPQSPAGSPLYAVVFYGRYVVNGVAQPNVPLRVNALRGTGLGEAECGETRTDGKGYYVLGVRADGDCAYRPEDQCCEHYRFYAKHEGDVLWVGLNTEHYRADLNAPALLGKAENRTVYRYT